MTQPAEPPPVILYQSASLTPAPKQPLAVHWSAILCYFIALLIVIFLNIFIPYHTTDPSAQPAYYIGAALGLLLVSLIPAAIGFYLARRSKLVATILFLFFLTLGTLGQVAQAFLRLHANNAARFATFAAEADAARHDIIAEAKNGHLTSEQSIKLLDKLQDSSDTAAKDMTGSDAVVMQVSSDFIARMKTQAVQYNDALQLVIKESPITPSWIKSPDDLALARSHVQGLKDQTKAFRDFYLNAQTDLAARLTKAGLNPATVHAASAGFASKFYAARSLFIKMRDEDDQMSDDLLKICDLLEKNWGQWHTDPASHHILFTSPEVLHAYNDLFNDVQTTAAEQTKTQQALIKTATR